MSFKDVLVMREVGGLFAGGLFLIVYILSKTWMFLVGFIIGLIVSRVLRKEKGEKK